MEPPNKKPKIGNEDDVLATALGDTSVVQIYAGPEKTPFLVHESLLKHYSSYFRGMLSGSSNEAQSKKVEWIEEETSIVRMFVTWLYSQKLDLDKYEPPSPPSAHASATCDHPSKEQLADEGTLGYRKFPTLFKIWVFADRRGIPDLATWAVQRFHALAVVSQKLPVWRDMLWLWSNTTPGAGMTRLMVDLVAMGARLANFNPTEIEVPAAFYLLLIRRIAILRVTAGSKTGCNTDCNNTWRNQWKELNLCPYHEHADSTDCKGEKIKKTT